MEGGGDHHHHNHDHNHHDADHGDANGHHNTHDQHNEHQMENEIIPIKSAKEKSKTSGKNRKGRKFSNTGKRKEKNFNRPFPFRIPRTSFSCRDRAPGYYADMEADCQVG